MLKSLNYHITFPSTGRVLSQRIDFSKGMGAITGPNEAGKSFILEMIRYFLFGSAALRGRADDYKSLKGELVLSIKGDDYLVRRNGSNARLIRGDEDVAVGTRPVNEKLIKLLGFGLDVFDIACVANQGEIERLGSMKPTERKRMIDSVIGVGVIEDLGKQCGDEANSLTRVADGIERTLVEPVEPVRPEDYRPSAELRAELAELRKLQSEIDQINGRLRNPRVEPVMPEPQLTEPTAEAVEAQQKLRAMRAALQQQIDALPDIDTEPLRQQNAAAQLWKEKEQLLAKMPRHQPADLERWLADWDVIDADILYEHQRKRLDKLRARLTTCPNCQHQWGDHEREIAELEAELVEPTKPLPEMPPLQRGQIQQVQGAIQQFDWTAWERVKDAVPTEASKFSAGMLDRIDGRQALVRQLAALPEVGEDLLPAYKIRLQRDAEWQAYTKALGEYERWKVQDAADQERLAILQIQAAAITATDDQYQAAVQYETAAALYETAKVAFDTGSAELARLREEADGWKRGRAAMLKLRTLIKQHLIPSLNRVSSHLLLQMTGGQRQSIVIDDDFDVVVDGQPLSTLSGSGKAVANLAIRLALGQVLTNNVLSLFMGDELDASMDAERARNLTITLSSLKDRISQILLVTHKYPAADYYIELGRSDDGNIPAG